jgi:hypothetical protein
MDQKQYEAMLADAEMRLQRLKSLYDQWFQGIERVEPHQRRTDLEQIISTLRREKPRNTALRFRFQQLLQRFITFSTYWRRVARQIEEGTYKRDVIRARKLKQQLERGDKHSDESPGDLELDVELDADFELEAALDALRETAPASVAAKPPVSDAQSISPFAQPPKPPLAAPPVPGASSALPRPPPPAVPLLGNASLKPGVQGSLLAGGSLGPKSPVAGAAARPAAPGVPSALPRPPGVSAPRPLSPAVPAPAASLKPAAGGGAMSDQQMRGIYDKYIAARQQNSERTDNVKFESVVQSVQNMLPKLTQKHAGKKIDFEVVVKDGKVALKPVAK